MITAQEFLIKSILSEDSLEDMLIEFATICCIEQAKVISEKALMTGIAYGNDKSISDYEVDKESILNAYDLNLIK